MRTKLVLTAEDGSLAVGMSDDLLAVKPYTAYTGDDFLRVVLVRRATGEFVTWIWNAQTNGMSHGHYTYNYDEALKDFSARGFGAAATEQLKVNGR